MAPDIATYLPDVVLEAFDEELVVVAVAVVGETCEGANERERTAGKDLSLKANIVVRLSENHENQAAVGLGKGHSCRA